MSLYRLKRKLWVLTLNQLNCVAQFIFREYILYMVMCIGLRDNTGHLFSLQIAWLHIELDTQVSALIVSSELFLKVILSAHHEKQ